MLMIEVSELFCHCIDQYVSVESICISYVVTISKRKSLVGSIYYFNIISLHIHFLFILLFFSSLSFTFLFCHKKIIERGQNANAK